MLRSIHPYTTIHDLAHPGLIILTDSIGANWRCFERTATYYFGGDSPTSGQVASCFLLREMDQSLLACCHFLADVLQRLVHLVNQNQAQLARLEISQCHVDGLELAAYLLRLLGARGTDQSFA